MENNCLSFRWIHAACYEFRLPGGKVLITDPFITPPALPGFGVEDVTGADYILISHTHYDHTSDIRFLTDKFNSKLFVGEMSAPSLSNYLDLDYSHIFPLGQGEIYEGADFTLQMYRAKHTPHPKGHAVPSMAANVSRNNFGLEGYGECDKFGWLELCDYVITLKNNFTIMIVAGIESSQQIYEKAKAAHPALVIRQTAEKNPGLYAAQLARFGAQLCLPNHHEHLAQSAGMPAETFARLTAEALQTCAPYSSFMNPEPYRWYDVVLDVRAEETK